VLPLASYCSKICSDITLLPSPLPPYRFTNQNCLCRSCFCAHLPHSLTLVVFGEYCKLWSSFIYSSWNSPVACVLGPCICLFLKRPKPVASCIFVTHISNTLSLGPCILITVFKAYFHTHRYMSMHSFTPWILVSPR
jgi:hypothetical protein